MCVCVCVCMRVLAFMRVCLCAHMCICVCMGVCAFLSLAGNGRTRKEEEEASKNGKMNEVQQLCLLT